ncbi:UNVERIFIED_CONTAM: Glutamate receptor 2.7 [Sesamum calycinum]|uniref:Glutamate receptor n=1 Tax=Sesamum calycinum TaxID=2727403 RepID=A0AAW2SBZ7_9LAMI
MMKTPAFILFLLLLGCCYSYADDHKVSRPSNGDESIVNIGVIDMGSWTGQVVQSCIKMATSDFYNINSHTNKDCSSGKILREILCILLQPLTMNHLHLFVYVPVVSASASAPSPSPAAVTFMFRFLVTTLDLLENLEVEAIIISDISDEELFLARLADEVNVPLLSFSSIIIINEHPYFIQVAEDESNEFRGIAAFIDAFNWRSFVFLYEDTVDARQVQTYIYNISRENHLDIAYQTALSLRNTDDEIINELHKLKMTKSSIILVHLSPSLASRVFANAKMLGMMGKGYAWVVTSKTMNFLDSLDSSDYESMLGIVGFKSHISVSSKSQDLALRWRREFQQIESNLEIRDLNVAGLRAYDAAWVLAEAIERAGRNLSPNRFEISGSEQLNFARLRVSKNGPTILSKIISTNFTGLASEFQLANRKLVHETYEILNVIGNWRKRVGFWNSTYGLTKEMYSYDNSSPNFLETIIWPGFSLEAPGSWLVQMSGKIIRIGVPANGSRFPELVMYHDQRSKEIHVGFCLDVFTAAVKRLPYELSYEFIPFYDQNGSYSDLLYQVYLQTFDAAVGDITITSDRFAYVDFTVPYTELGVGFIVRLDDKDPWFFLKPLSADLWIMSACFFVLTGFIVWLIEHRINEEFQGPPSKQIGTLLSFAASTLVYAHKEKLQSNVSRFVVGVWLFVVLILTSSYIANLSSLLTVAQIKLAKSDSIGYPANSPIRGFMVKNNLNFTDNRFKTYQSPEEYDAALRIGSKRGGVRAIIDEVPYIKVFLARYPHDYTMIESSLTTGGFGFAFQKGSPLVDEMSRAITELREEGRLEEMEKKWFKSGPSLPSQDSEQSKLNTLTVANFFGLFLISGISTSIALLVFVIFLLHEKLSINYNMATILGRGRLMSILRLFYPRMGTTIHGVDAR